MDTGHLVEETGPSLIAALLLLKAEYVFTSELNFKKNLIKKNLIQVKTTSYELYK